MAENLQLELIFTHSIEAELKRLTSIRFIESESATNSSRRYIQYRITSAIHNPVLIKSISDYASLDDDTTRKKL